MSNMTEQINYIDDTNKAIFNGELFYYERDTGYYVSSDIDRKRFKRLHQVVWMYYNYTYFIPEYHVIHHKDFNPLNNHIDNLELLTVSKHVMIHSNNPTIKQQLARKAFPKRATAWHKSKEGRKFHREYRKKQIEDRPYTTKKCAYCQATFKTKYPEIAKYCSDNCKRNRNNMVRRKGYSSNI